MKKIKLTKEKYTIVDDFKFPELSMFKWHYDVLGYAARRLSKKDGRKLVRLHNILLKGKKDLMVDHINGDKLDNRLSNLRLVTKSQNMMNRGRTRTNKSGFKGVYLDSYTNKWKAQIKIGNKNKSLGRFSTPIEAAKAYNDAAKVYHKEFANLNKI